MTEFELVPLDEQETTIDIDYREKRAYVYTSRAAIAKKLLSLCKENSDSAEFVKADKYGVEISVPVDWISIKPKKKRVLSEEERAALIKRLSSARELRIK